MKEEILTAILSERPTEIAEVKNLCAFLATTLLHFTSDDSKELEGLVKQVELEIKNSRNRLFDWNFAADGENFDLDAIKIPSAPLFL